MATTRSRASRSPIACRTTASRRRDASVLHLVYTPRERERCHPPPWTKEGRRDVKPALYGATCVTSPRGSRDGLRYRNGKLRKLSRNATPEPPFSSAERATVDSADYTSGPDAAKHASQAEFLRGPASTTLWPGSLKLGFG